MIHDRRPPRPSRSQRLHREPDPRVRRSVALWLGAAALAVLVTLGIAGLRIHQVQLAYRLEALRVERAAAERLMEQLRVEAATLVSPARMETHARALGLVAPAHDQVRLAREYVAGTGTAADARGGARSARSATSGAVVR